MTNDRSASPSVSIIIPAFNAERFIGETIQSALNQTYQDFEIVVIDDGSTDDTPRVIDDIKDVRIRYIYQENQGSASARNRGIRLSRGDHIAFLDSDDIWHPEMLERCVEIITTRPEIGVVHTNWRFINEEGKILPGKGSWEPWRGDVFERLILHNPFITPGMVIRRECVNNGVLVGETASSGDDWGMWLRIAMRGHLFDCIEQPVVFYRRHEANISLDYRNIVHKQEAFLNSFFSQSDIPARILEMRNRAFARIYLNTSILAFRRADTDIGIAYFERAVRMEASLLFQLSTYYEIICSSQPIGFEGSNLQISLEEGEKYLLRALDHVFQGSLEETAINHRKSEIFALAFFAIGSVAYAHLQDFSVARRYFLRSVTTYPLIALKTRVVDLLIRTLLGKRLISILRNIKSHLDGSLNISETSTLEIYDSSR